MEMKSSSSSPVLTDPSPINKRLGIHTGLPSFSSGKYINIPRKKIGKLDDVRSNGWLDAMKSSSPPRKKFIKGFSTAAEDPDFAYCSWMLKYPSALSSFEHITHSARNKKIAVFLDYDGTLSPIVDDPDQALMSEEMRSAVRNVAKYFPTAIISGRSRDKVYELVGLRELYYAGSHGMDIMGPTIQTVPTDHHLNSCVESTTDQQGKEVNLFQPAREFISMIDEVFRTLVENTKDIKGSKVENHKFCTSVHYRNVDEKVLEVRPEIEWDKGKAVEFLLESLDLSDVENVLPIYIGDDRTDEDAFKVLRQGKRGYGILVSSVAKESSAFYSLRDPTEVMRFLNSLVVWKRLLEGGGSGGKMNRRTI
ncbi:unnamed protein product [Linum tenue]|uniref:Trehalose-phosphatase n=1 Tax=Linum tenue TaxID=586396 RepID=A0AAV0JUT0_9ROSI|nr:unnamed protein product [Linum tenue]